MIELIIADINTGITGLNIFARVNGLCELIDEPFKTDDGDFTATFPALYKGKDHLRYVSGGLDYKAGVVFHLAKGNITPTQLERIRAREKRTENNWPLKVIAMVRRNIYNTDSAYSPAELLSNIKTKVSKLYIPGLKAQLNVDKIMVNITSSSTDKKAIIEETFINVPFPAVHDLMVVKVEYEIIIQGNEQCFLKYGC